MRLAIEHRTTYRYSEAVSEAYNELRLQPVSDARQECLSFEARVIPGVAMQRYHDFHLNLVDHFFLAEPHRELVIEGRSKVRTLASEAEPQVAFPRERLSECMRWERCYEFLQRSEYVSLGIDVWRLGQDATAGSSDLWSMALGVMRAVHQGFRYDTAATTVASHLEDVVRLRAGVCQDFAHVMIGMCRSVQIPARYVSGYLYVAPGESLRGDLASHAWVEVFCPGVGWVGMDPTNNRLADPHHVKVAVGRDYADAAPIRGNFKGTAHQEMHVELSITELPEPGSGPAAGAGDGIRQCVARP
ncbi:MAG: transglutaminase family protein [Verrucomicrobiales bacterium]|nr:transglutaminase family protein [Verrucomicrobiales bacterium]